MNEIWGAVLNIGTFLGLFFIGIALIALILSAVLFFNKVWGHINEPHAIGVTVTVPDAKKVMHIFFDEDGNWKGTFFSSGAFDMNGIPGKLMAILDEESKSKFTKKEK